MCHLTYKLEKMAVFEELVMEKYLCYMGETSF